MNDWLKELKPGDQVFVDRGGFGTVPTIKTVTSVNKRFVTVGGWKHSLKDGFRIGSSGYDRERIRSINDRQCLLLVHREDCEEAISDLKAIVGGASVEDCKRVQKAVERLTRSIRETYNED